MAKHLITAALPYANGPLHVGHLLEYIQADIYARYLRMQGEDVLYVCASDMHGTPIQIAAEKIGKSPEDFASKYWKMHLKEAAKFGVSWDVFYKTHSPENRDQVLSLYAMLQKKGLIYTKEVLQMYDEQAGRFLPDRLVKGQCPKCAAADQYGDVCEACGATYRPTELIKPYSTVSQTTPIEKATTHYFFRLSTFSMSLKQWIERADLQEEMKNFALRWITEGLQDWCISRDDPYFGFAIPKSVEETGKIKYFYVWLDAPVGYISATQHHTADWKSYWYQGQVHHFIGKDIIYFHYLFWPAMLMAMGMPMPTLSTHGFVTVNGKKMSKSRGTFITAKDFAADYPAEALRFYYASHLQRKIVDVDVDLDNFVAVNNNVLLANLGNFCYRVLSFASKHYASIGEGRGDTEAALALVEKVNQAYAALDYKSAVEIILQLADLGNAYFQQAEPWVDPKAQQASVAWCVNLARNLAVLVAPIMPEFSAHVAGCTGLTLQWGAIGFDWTGAVSKPTHLVKQLEVRRSFALQLRVGKIIAVRDHVSADKLYVFTVDFGDEQRQVIAGLKKYFTADQLLGRKAVFCCNLAPAKIRGEDSQAMSLVAEKGKALVLLDPGDAAVGATLQLGDLETATGQISFDAFCAVKMTIKNKHVVVGDAVLHSAQGPIVVEIADGAKVA